MTFLSIAALFFVAGSCLMLWRRPVQTAVALTVVACFWDLLHTTGVPEADSVLQFGPSIYPLDVGCFALMFSAVVVLLRTGALPRDLCWPAVGLLGLCALDWLRGTLEFGLRPAGNLSRDMAYLVLPAVAITSLAAVMRLNTQKVVVALSLVAIAFGAIAIARWCGILATPEILMGSSEEFRPVVRVLPAESAIIIGQALIGIVGVQLVRGFRPLGVILAGAFTALVFALQHRSVWVATVGGLLWLAVRSPRAVYREWLKFSVLITLVASAVAFSILMLPEQLDRGVSLVRANLDEVNSTDSTWAWRVEGYSEAMQRLFSDGATDAMVGPPTGADLSSKASQASITIHDRYVSVLVNYGAAGFIVLGLWLIVTAARIYSFGLARAPESGRSNKESVILEALLLSVSIYFVPYNGEVQQGLLMGAIWLASAHNRHRVEQLVATRASNDAVTYTRPLAESPFVNS